MSKHTFALVDCNNFYVACEKLFRPDLRDKPVVVLSNNDGCIVSRSPEAKALGLKMAMPYFHANALIRRHGVIPFSSNYALYADISNRVMATLEHLAPRIEIYSIDEAFVDCTGIPDLLGFGQQVRQTVLQWTGIQVCVGMAPTKTLAKLANHAAKQYPATGGVVDLTDRKRQLKLMKLMPVDEVWGVGRRIAAKLCDLGIHTALDLAQANPKNIRRHFSVVLERTLAELNGENCLELDDITAPRQQIISSRSFGHKVTKLARMREAICEYTSIAAEKLRKENQVTKKLSVFIRTSGFEGHDRQYSNQATLTLVTHSSDTRELVARAMQLLEQIWRDGYSYAKGGVMLSDLCPADAAQADLFDPETKPDNPALMQVIDHINQSGKGRIFLARQGMRKDWAMKQQFLSPRYTTRWADIPIVK